MKKRVLIVEDDKFFRFAVKKVINWEKYGFQIVGEAVHGAAALEFLGDHPVEVVITDMSMPVMNGIELTAAIKEKYPDILIIALSAYDDFEFVKESLKLGAQDYILKQDIEKVDVGETIRKAWQKHFENMTNESEKCEAIWKYLLGDPEEVQGRHYLELCMDGQWGCCLCQIENLKEEWQSPQCRRAVWMEDSFLELHEKRSHLLLVPMKKEHSRKLQMEDRNRRIMELEAFLEQEDYLAGCSSFGTAVEDLPVMARETKQAMEVGRFSRRKRIQIWEYVRAGYDSRNTMFMADKEMYGAIDTLEQAQDELRKLTEKLCAAMPSQENVQKNYLLFLNTVAQNLHREMDKLEFAGLKEELAKAALIEKQHEICSQYEEKLFSESDSEIMHPGVRQAIRYMKQNYDKELSLGDIADEVALNEGYFSGLFKKDTGRSITDYLNEIRMEKAKELIAGTNYKNYEIAQKVGISNSSYFSTIFKKYTGMTIQEYRRKVT